jgi:tetratricopeptide (TPR) repeat protein
MSILQKGIAAAKAGDKDQAREILQDILTQDPKNEEAWWWLASVLEKKDAIICLKNILKINPSNQKAQAALAKLRSGSSISTATKNIEPQRSAPPGWNKPEEQITEYSFSIHRRQEEMLAWIEVADYLYKKGQSPQQMEHSLKQKGLERDYITLVIKHFLEQHRKVALKKMVRGGAGCLGGLLIGVVLFLFLFVVTGNVIVVRTTLIVVGGTILLGGALFLGGLFQFLKALWLD